MNYAKIRNYDIANGEGVRTSLFVSGCTNHCPGCFNPELQEFGYGNKYTEQTERQILQMLKQPMIAGLSILGGDPLSQADEDIDDLVWLCNKTHELNKTVWLWTGYVWEDIMIPSSFTQWQKMLLLSCDVVVDGPFRQELANMALKWRGSANQRIIDVKKAKESGHVILYLS